MSFRRATATVLISMGVVAALLEACAASDPATNTTRGTGNGTGNGTGTGGGTGSGAGGGTGSGGTTTTGGGGGPPPINPGNPEAGADIKVGADAACAGQSTTGELKQTDLYMMMDNSGSMDMIDPGQTLSRWDNLAQAIPGFVNDPANAGMMVGLDFFPEGGTQASCNVADYTMANVPVDLLPGPNGMQASAIVAAVTGRARSGGTPTTPALTGAIQAAKTWQMAHTDRSLSVLFLTDGEPTGCNPNTVMTASAAAQAGANGMPPIKTYVLGIGPSTGNLDQIAAAGGTMKAYMATSGGAAELSKALADIRKNSGLGCDYAIPKGDGGMIDYGRIVVSVSVGGMGSKEIPNVVNVAGCAGNPMNPNGEGWYYDIPPPGTPTKITICPNSCGPLKVTSMSTVNILLGCVPRVIPPPN